MRKVNWIVVAAGAVVGLAAVVLTALGNPANMNYIRMEFPSRSSNEGFARVAVACFASQMDPTLNELEDIKTAVSEAVTNAIVHAYPDSIGRVSLKVRICEGNVLEITVKDAGKGIPNVEKARQPM